MLSAVPADSSAFGSSSLGDQDSPVVITPPPIMEGRGLVKKFWNRPHLLPFHAGLFSCCFGFLNLLESGVGNDHFKFICRWG